MMELEVSKLLDYYFHDADDLTNLDALQLDLQSQCDLLQTKLDNAGSQVRESAAHASAQMEAVAGYLDRLCAICQDHSVSWSSKGEVVSELSELAAEVSRVAEVRAYVEAVLQLERLIGDLEDAVFAAASTHAAPRLSSAVEALGSIEKLMVDITRCRPQWQRLISAVDIRVDRAAATLRPIAVADYRAAVSATGWPPPLSISTENKSNQTNPLLEMNDETRHRFRESFVSLSRFQAVQIQRRSRAGELEDSKDEVLSSSKRRREPLLSIEELVFPVAEKFEARFRQWLHKPEFVFALSYKVARQHVAVIDGILQPMLDEEFLGYNAREEWVSDFVTIVSEHLRRWAIPTLLKDMEDNLADEASTVWLHTVDQTLAFDAKMQALVVEGPETGSAGGIGDEGFYNVVDSIFGLREACISVFADRGDWFEVWTKLELNDVNKKLRPEYENESMWRLAMNPGAEFKTPAAAYKLTAAVWNVIERCRTLPEANQRLTFIGGTAMPVLDGFLEELLQRCHEAEASTALADEESMMKVCVSLNAARYCENTLNGWCEGLFFLELRLSEELQDDTSSSTQQLSDVEGSIFDTQLRSLARFRTSWIGKLVSVISRGFEARAREYFRNKKRWSDDTAAVEVDAPSANLVEALAELQSQLMSLKSNLDLANFVELWQRLIPSLDQLMFQGVVISGAKFSEQGGQQFAFDVESLFRVFRQCCARPASFFSALSDSVKLLKLDQQEVSGLVWKLSNENESEDAAVDVLKQSGIRKMSSSIALRILNSRLN